MSEPLHHYTIIYQ